MECREVRQLTKSFVDGEATTVNNLRYLKHIEGCAACRDELETEVLTRLVLKNDNGHKESSEDYDLDKSVQKLIKRRKRGIVLQLSTAAALLLILAAGITLLVLHFNGVF